jgi:hypothetical protein
MGKILQFPDRQQNAKLLLEEVREALESFDGDQNDRKRYVHYVIRRCEKLKLENDSSVIAQLENMLDGFLD